MAMAVQTKATELASVVQKLDSAISRKNRYAEDKYYYENQLRYALYR